MVGAKHLGSALAIVKKVIATVSYSDVKFKLRLAPAVL